MSYRIEEIEGIGPSYGSKLEAAGIHTTNDLLKHCASRAGRKKVAEAADISEKLLLKWANLADLMRIKGIGKQFSELLEAGGVDTIKELRHRNAENLTAKLREANAEKKLTRAVPGLAQVEAWIASAKELDPTITH
ncbi:MAG: DUF4332 domain-containing protein [Acidobacteriota bacterium]